MFVRTFLFVIGFYAYLAAADLDYFYGLKPICPPNHNDGDSGFIQSLNFPQNYSNQMDCMSRITVSEGNRVQLIFYAFETELGADIVTLYEGFGPNKKEITQLSGTPARGIYSTTESNIMSVRFKTDLDTSFEGYYAYYKAISPKQNPSSQNCPRVEKYTNPYGVVVSPLWPEFYPNQAHCLYSIQLGSEYDSIKFRVNFFETEENADILFVYNGINPSPPNLKYEMSGQFDNGNTFTINSPSATLLFVSDLDNRFAGYSITYIGHKIKP